MFTLFCRKVSFCLCPFAPLETPTLEEKSIFYFFHKMRTKMLEGFQPATIYYRSRWDEHWIRLYYICCLLHLPIRYQALPAVRERVRPARHWVWAGTCGPVMQTPPVSSDGPYAYIQYPLRMIPKNATSCNSCVRITWLEKGNWAPSDSAGHRLPIHFSNEVSVCIYHCHQFSFLDMYFPDIYCHKQDYLSFRVGLRPLLWVKCLE